jgi:aryl-alcohol dehydrogenase-like predicted oxidoreductase
MNLFQKSFNAEVGYLLDPKMVLKNDIQLALQFCRSTPGVISSLFASKVPVNIKNNLKIAQLRPTAKAQYDLMYKV